MSEFDFLRQALKEAIEERRLNSVSSRLDDVLALIRQNRAHVRTQLETLERQLKVGVAANLLAEAKAMRRKLLEGAKELDALLAEGEAAKARRPDDDDDRR